MLTVLFILVLAMGVSAFGARWPWAAALTAVLAAWAMTRLPDLEPSEAAEGMLVA